MTSWPVVLAVLAVLAAVAAMPPFLSLHYGRRGRIKVRLTTAGRLACLAFAVAAALLLFADMTPSVMLTA